ncbi:MAG TPA: malectin domain-containing carbohydrate-binding protein, partial [bacterium]
RVDCGSSSPVTDSQGVWAADENYSGGSVTSTGASIIGATDQTLYQSARTGSQVNYAFNVPPGNYQVTLKFAETVYFYPLTRVFNILINGQIVLGNFDIFADVGGNTADDRMFDNISPNALGQIQIQLAPDGNLTGPSLCAIQIITQPALSYVWTQATSAAPFSAREGHASVLYNSQMWVIGGSDSGGDKNDVWASSDGVSWIQKTSGAAFSARDGHQVLVYNSKMWVIGGQNYNSGTSQTTYLNDVWSSTDGITWSQATGSAAFNARCFAGSLVYNGQMWVMGGRGYHYYPTPTPNPTCFYDPYTPGIPPTPEIPGPPCWFGANFTPTPTFTPPPGESSDTNDVWSSTDGVNWSRKTFGAAFGNREQFGAVSYNQRMWV